MSGTASIGPSRLMSRVVSVEFKQAAWSFFQTTARVVLIILAILTGLFIAYNVTYKFGTTMNGAPVFPEWKSVNNALLGVHIATAVPPLFIGFYAFSPVSRRAGNRGHRWLGTAYCVCIWISAVTGLILATANTRGIGAQLGFGCLAVAWFSTTYFAYTTARAKHYVTHRQWMIRSFALTMAVLTVRPLYIFGPTTDAWYVLVTWICWLPNLTLAEIYLRITHYTGKLAWPRSGDRRGVRS
jgi:uncharacterized membrane protein